MCPIPELRGRDPFFLLEECGELAGILEMQAIGDLGDRQRVWEDKHYLYPIPDLDIIMNPNLTQNPGW